MSEDIDKLKARIAHKKEPKGLPFDRGLSTGSTLLNLACTGRPNVGLLPGFYYIFIGDSNSGKTWIAHSVLAEASMSQHYKDYRLIYDPVERGALMDVRKYFGTQLSQRIEPPRKDKENNPIFSETIEDFYFNIDDAVKQGKPFVYVEDSIDSLDSESSEKKFQQQKKAARRQKGEGKEEEVKGSYGDGKAKANSQNLRRFISPLSRLESILLIINQTRDNIGINAMFNPKTRSGGNALIFYATIQIWSSVKEKIKKVVGNKQRHIGNLCRFQIKRSRFTGRDVSVDVPIYYSHGIDDTGSCVDFLISEGKWKKGKVIDATELKLKASRENLIEEIEKNNLEKDLRRIVTEVWQDIEEGCRINRKRRYQ